MSPAQRIEAARLRLYSFAEGWLAGESADEAAAICRELSKVQAEIEAKPLPEEMDLARTRLHEILTEVARNDWRPWDCAETLARLMTPDAIRGLAAEQRESEGAE